jgi:5-methylcytosine-specific restriction protein B
MKRDTSHVLAAAEQWIRTCLIEDGSIFSTEPRWTALLVTEVFKAFVEHPDFGDDDFMTKLKGQMKNASPQAQQLTAEMLWALLLFPSNMKARTKRQQVREIWALSGQPLAENLPLLDEQALFGIGSGGPGFNNYRPNELEYLIALVRDLKDKNESERRRVLTDYDAFMGWLESVPRKGSRQFRHMLRYFAFPDRVERISSNNDRRKILKAFGSGSAREVAEWNDRQLDEKLAELRARLQAEQPAALLDFYEPPLNERWSRDQTIKTVEGEVEVTVPRDEDEVEDIETAPAGIKSPEARQSIQIQAKLARIGAVMGFKVWIPRSDRGRVSEVLQAREQAALLQDLPLNFDGTTMYAIEQIDVLWLKGRAIYRAFEVEQTTAVYSGLLRMADLLALQPNMDIHLHIVAPDERREKVFTE